MPNRLANETSPYLLQHAHNPVDWYPWGPEALERAKREDKPIFLSIGYAACHWCHVMERESFEDAATAEDLNRDFVAVKVDREERPDLDQVYMSAVQAMTGQGGWPMSLFLTPDGKPFYGGTYFPPQPGHGLPAFRQLLAGVARAWRDERLEIIAAGQRLVDALVKQQTGPSTGDVAAPTRELLDAATAAIEASFDARNGGWGGAPKFPQPMTIEYLLRRANATGDARPLAAARRSLDAMADGGIRDQLGGGFHRYSTDEIWLVPHFEQMLYDNAQLARVYTHAFALTGSARYQDVAVGTLNYMVRELRRDDGTFAASQDADTEGVEGKTFTWTADEVRDVLGEAADPFLLAYGVTSHGNWEHTNVLSRVTPPIGGPAVERELAESRARLLERRDSRPQPTRDDKALAAWNGLAIGALADGARFLPGGEPYLAVATQAAEAILAGLLRPDGRLGRSWKDGRSTGEGVLEDYAHLADGLLALYEASFDERWFAAARSLADTILDRFGDPVGGFYRHRGRPRDARHATKGRPGQRRSVRQLDGRIGPPQACGPHGRGALPGARRAGDRDRDVLPRPLSHGLCKLAVRRPPRCRRDRRAGDRRRPLGSRDKGACRRHRIPAECRRCSRGQPRGDDRPAARGPGPDRRSTDRVSLPRLRLPRAGDRA